MSGSSKQAVAGVKDSDKPENDPPESKACRDVRRDLTNLASQVQMISDSLAACKQMSKARPLRKMYSVKGNAQVDTAAPQASVQVLLSPEEGAVEEERSVIVSYMVRETQKLRKDESEETDSCQQQSCSRRRGSWSSLMEESPELQRESSKIHMYDHGEMDSLRMVDIIQRELKALVEVAPPVVLLATALSDTLSHYKECDRCSEKISPSLPWILNRIQKLIKYVTTQRQGTYRWPDDYSYLRLRPKAPTAPLHFSHRKPLAKSEKVDVLSFTEDHPGLQLLLEVKPDTTHKKVYEKAENRSVAPRNSFLNFSVVQLREPQSVPLVQVLVPTNDPAILLDEKREAVAVKEYAYALRLVFAFRVNPLVSFLFLAPRAILIRTRRPELHHKPAHLTSSQERSVYAKKKNPKGPQSRGAEKTVRQNENLPKRSNDKKPFSPRDLLARVPEIVREFLREAETEKMHDQKVQNLEAGAKGLRDLMTEVQRNQMELSKVLLEKGVYPQPIIKLTDPNMLDKENEVIRTVAELQQPGSRRVSVEALQTAMDDLKHKCALKNRMILIILKGLRSNIPKEWWEDMVDYVFDESKPIEDFDPEKVSEMVRQASRGPGKGEHEASRPSAWALGTEEQACEEEPNRKGSVGADVEEYHKTRLKNDGVVAETKDVASETLSEKIVAFSAEENPSSVNTSIRKLENQVSLLNTENERLRHEVEDLKNLLRSSVDDLQGRKVSCADSEQRPLPRAPGKTINLTIQIVDKDLRRVNDVMRLSNISVTEGTVSPSIKYADLKESEAKEGVSHASASFSGADRDGSEGNWSYLEYSLGREKLDAVLRERSFGQSPHRAVHQVTVTNGHPSGQDLFRKPKPISWVPSKYRIPEVSDGCGAGPSRRPVDVGHLLQKPSVMELAESQSSGMLASMANERELQTIPENDCSPSPGSSKGMSQAIQQLRTRVRSIHKDVTVLKSKNDRIDKLLERLMDDTVENSESFEEIENNFHRLKDRLG